jgi:hypothetical protein
MGLLEAVLEETLLEIARRQAALGFNGRRITSGTPRNG